MGRILDVDPFTGLKETFHKTDNGFIIQTSQDVKPILDRNDALRNNGSGNWKGDMHHIASIPMVVVQQWWKELGGDPFSKKNRPFLIKKLNDRDWYRLKTKEGNL